MAKPQKQLPPPPDPPKAATDETLNAVLDVAQHQLRDVLQQATSNARREVDALANVISEREAEISALEASLIAERTSLEAERKAVAGRLATANERQRVADAQMAEAKALSARATKSLADALERSAQVAEEAEARVLEDVARSRAKMDSELKDARTQAVEIHAHAARRLEAVRVESEATLQRAVDRAMGIVAAAEGSAEKSKASLREIVERMEDYLRRESAPGFDLEAELAIDLRTDVGPKSEAAPSAVDSEPASVAALPPSPVETPAEGDDAPPSSETVAGEDAMNGSLGEGETDEAVDDAVTEQDPTDQRVANAVRRAVRGWSTARQEAQ